MIVTLRKRMEEAKGADVTWQRWPSKDRTQFMTNHAQAMLWLDAEKALPLLLAVAEAAAPVASLLSMHTPDSTLLKQLDRALAALKEAGDE